MKKVLTIGGAMLDTFIRYELAESLVMHKHDQDEEYIIMRAGRKVDVHTIEYYCGGGAANSAVSFARLGCSVESFFKIGSDKDGQKILGALARENVSTSHIIISDDVATGVSFIIPGPSGNAAVLACRGANITIKKEEIPVNAFGNVDHVYITSLSGAAAPLLLPMVALAKKYSKKIAANPGTSQLKAGPELLKNALSHIDILILNAYEAQLLMTSLTTFLPPYPANSHTHEYIPQLLGAPMGSSIACFTLPQFFQEIHRCGPSVVVVTNGAEGVYVSDKNTLYFHPSIKINMVSSIGAGDAFGSAFVAFLMDGSLVEDALRAGIVNSASVIQHVGTQTGLLSRAELEKRIQQIDTLLLQKYRLS